MTMTIEEFLKDCLIEVHKDGSELIKYSGVPILRIDPVKFERNKIKGDKIVFEISQTIVRL